MMEPSVGVGERESGSGRLTAQERQFYADNGYLFLERVFGGADLDAIREALPAVFAEDSALVTYNRTDNRLREVASPRPEFLASRDHSPLRALEGTHPTLAG